MVTNIRTVVNSGNGKGRYWLGKVIRKIGEEGPF